MDHSSKTTQTLDRIGSRESKPSDLRMVATMLLALISFWALLSGPAFSQPMPEHASAKSYGDGWQCDVGYRLNEGICTTITVPENAYATNRTYGAGWPAAMDFEKHPMQSVLKWSSLNTGFWTRLANVGIACENFAKSGIHVRQLSCPQTHI